MFVSKEELYFSWWLDDMKKAGFVEEYFYEPTTFLLCDKVVKKYEEIVELKTKTKVIPKSITLMQDLKYTPDFKVVFKQIPEFFKRNFFIQDNIWWVDCKGSFIGRNNNSAITFPLNQKFMYVVHGILVEKIIPQKLFKSTFTPERYIRTDGDTRLRKINWKVKKIENN